MISDNTPSDNTLSDKKISENSALDNTFSDNAFSSNTLWGTPTNTINDFESHGKVNFLSA